MKQSFNPEHTTRDAILRHEWVRARHRLSSALASVHSRARVHKVTFRDYVHEVDPMGELKPGELDRRHPTGSERQHRCNYVHKIEGAFDSMGSTSAHQPWLAGERDSLADPNVTLHCQRREQLEKTRLWEEHRSRVREWLMRVQARLPYPIFDRLKAKYAA